MALVHPSSQSSDASSQADDRAADRSSDRNGRPMAGSDTMALSQGLHVPRHFTRPEMHPFDEIEWDQRVSRITEPDGTIVFEMTDVEVPKTWSQLATDIIVSKYFRKAGLPADKSNGRGMETSARQVVTRLARTIRSMGEQWGYFASQADADSFEMELTHLLITQKGAFNSPVWFNCGLWHEYGIEGSGGNWYWDEDTQSLAESSSSYQHPQCSACFIQAVDDDLMSIFDLVKNEARLFKYGSGTGTNFSRIRGRQEHLSGGGTSSGLMSFLEVLDRAAGATKSGGTTRRAAKMVTLNMDHPEILDFIRWKAKEEKKVKALIDAGYSADFNGEAYKTVAGQNANNSVRINDRFMEAYLNGEDWHTTLRTTGEVCETFKAGELMEEVAQAAWACADPGVQFDDVINKWHTCLDTDRIYGSNPCSEYHFLDNTACNLASINLMKFAVPSDTVGVSLDIEGFRHACRIFFIAQEILVDFASYPTRDIAKNSHNYRPLGLGYANLGTLLMVSGIPYDSAESYATSAAITAIMTGHAYRTSSEMAAIRGPFAAYNNNRNSMLRVMNQHRDASYAIDAQHCPPELFSAATQDWDEAVALGEQYGYRNAQATVIAPTGTIGLLMDCDTTGIEPDFALVKWKKLAGGGYFKIVNQSLPRALAKLGYNEAQIQEIKTYILGHGMLEGAPHMGRQALEALGFSGEDIDKAYASVKNFTTFNEWTPGISTKQLLEAGMSPDAVHEVERYVNGTQTIEGAPHLKDEHLPVFDCANQCGEGVRFIDPMAHIKIMAATQPFISGAISKTVNMPHETTVDDIKNIYVESWRMGLKCVALYRDGSKHSQVLSGGKKKKEDSDDKADAKAETAVEEAPQQPTAPISLSSSQKIDPTLEAAETPTPQESLHWGQRRRLPQKRAGITVDASVAGHKVHVRTGDYKDGQLGEIFVDMFKEGAAYRSMVNCFAVAVSYGLQYGVPLEKFVDAFTFTRFEPAGMTDHPNVKMCTSVVDYIFRVLGMEYLGRTDFVQNPPTDASPVNVRMQRDESPTANLAHSVTLSPAEMAKEVPSRQTQLELDEVPVKSVTDPELASSMIRAESLKSMMGDAPLCSNCGNITQRNGSCYRCDNCGNSEGCS